MVLWAHLASGVRCEHLVDVLADSPQRDVDDCFWPSSFTELATQSSWDGGSDRAKASSVSSTGLKTAHHWSAGESSSGLSQYRTSSSASWRMSATWETGSSSGTTSRAAASHSTCGNRVTARCPEKSNRDETSPRP